MKLDKKIDYQELILHLTNEELRQMKRWTLKLPTPSSSVSE